VLQTGVQADKKFCAKMTLELVHKCTTVTKHRGRGFQKREKTPAPAPAPGVFITENVGLGLNNLNPTDPAVSVVWTQDTCVACGVKEAFRKWEWDYGRVSAAQHREALKCWEGSGRVRLQRACRRSIHRMHMLAAKEESLQRSTNLALAQHAVALNKDTNTSS
jgi:hypothetical protein